MPKMKRAQGGQAAGTSINDRIRSLVNSNDVVVFMKGTPEFPQCGFSKRAVDILKLTGAPFKVSF